MTPSTFAAAQSMAIAGDLQANIARHPHFMQVAAEQGALIVAVPWP